MVDRTHHEELAAATRRLIRTVDAMAETAYAEPSLLPDWTRGDVVAHLALNAEGMAGALRGLTEGTSVPMYASEEARDGDIATLGRARPEAIRNRLLGGTTDFNDAVNAVPEDVWGIDIERVPGGRTFKAGAVPGMRHREVEIHHADLGLGYSHADWPPAFAVRLIEAMAETRPPGAAGRARHRRGAHLAPRRRWTDRARTRRRAGLVAHRPRRWRRALLRRRGAAQDRGVVTYTGSVTVGGAPDVRELTHLTITKVAVDKEMSNNAYLLRCRHTGEQVLVDAAAEPDVLLPLIGEAGLTTVVTTHQHWDHHRALADVVAATGCRRGGRRAGRRRDHRADRCRRDPSGRAGRHGGRR